MKSGDPAVLYGNKMNKAGDYERFSGKAEAKFFGEGNSLQHDFGFWQA